MFRPGVTRVQSAVLSPKSGLHKAEMSCLHKLSDLAKKWRDTPIKLTFGLANKKSIVY